MLTAVTRNKLGKHRRDPQISAASSLIVRCAVRHSRESTLCSLSPFPLFMYYRRSLVPIRVRFCPRHGHHRSPFSTNLVPARAGCRPIHKNRLTLASHVATSGEDRSPRLHDFDTAVHTSIVSSSRPYYAASVTPLISHPLDAFLERCSSTSRLSSFSFSKFAVDWTALRCAINDRIIR